MCIPIYSRTPSRTQYYLRPTGGKPGAQGRVSLLLIRKQMRASLSLAWCVSLSLAQDVTWCAKAPQSAWPLCDPSADITSRAIDVVGRLSLPDKFAALVTNTKGLNSIGLPSYNWWSEATHGISHVSYSAELPGASNTALPITTSCSFNRTLWKSTGNQIGREGRAFMNAGQAASTYWAPVIVSRGSAG